MLLEYSIYISRYIDYVYVYIYIQIVPEIMGSSGISEQVACGAIGLSSVQGQWGWVAISRQGTEYPAFHNALQLPGATG